MIIGVTGASGSGKSIVSKKLKESLNAKIVDADKIAKSLAQKGNKYYEQIIEYFGEGILNEEKEINRKRLAEIVYEDRDKLSKLNEITKEYVVDKIKEEAMKEEMTILDVPLLIESGLNNICDIVISVIANEDVKLKRICERDDIDADIAKKRLGIQPKDDFYIEHSDYIVRNNGESLEEQIKEIITCIKLGKN